jgi:hypothetical protein
MLTTSCDSASPVLHFGYIIKQMARHQGKINQSCAINIICCAHPIAILKAIGIVRLNTTAQKDEYRMDIMEYVLNRGSVQDQVWAYKSLGARLNWKEIELLRDLWDDVPDHGRKNKWYCITGGIFSRGNYCSASDASPHFQPDEFVSFWHDRPIWVGLYHKVWFDGRVGNLRSILKHNFNIRID